MGLGCTGQLITIMSYLLFVLACLRGVALVTVTNLPSSMHLWLSRVFKGHHGINCMYVCVCVCVILPYCIQVLSKSVADLFQYFRKIEPPEAGSVYKDTSETERFCRIFNHLFDCLNTRNLYEADHKRNPALKPYTSKDDERLKVHACIANSHHA